MEKLIMELRRRHVFRATGLYIGIAWILLQGADLLLPAFEAPAWVFRALVIAAIAGTPLTATLAWIYEYTDHGLKRQERVKASDLSSAHGRQMDFIVIGVLVVALSFSVYLNLQDAPLSPTVLDPVSILVADFENETGDPVFDGLLETALTVGLEGAPFVMAFSRTMAARITAKLDDAAGGLDVEAARLVSVQQGIKYVLAGTVHPNGSAYALSVVVLDPVNGEAIAETTASAQTKSEILGAVGSLAGQIRAVLGDTSFGSGDLPSSQTFTSTSIDAASDYSKAIVLDSNQRYEEALEYYQRAIDADPNFGRALVGSALTLFRIGRTDEAEAIWQKAEFLLHTMTERERLRVLALYYLAALGNEQRAQDILEQLVERYPADAFSQNNLAVAYGQNLDFQRGLQKLLQVTRILPKNVNFQSNLALFAMYSGDFQTAIAAAGHALEQEPNQYIVYVPLAIAALAHGDVKAALRQYNNMAEINIEAHSRATEGLADTAIYTGNSEEAKILLADGIRRDLDAGMTTPLARKAIALASVLTMEGSNNAAQEAIEEALKHSRKTRVLFSAAHLQIQLGQAKLAVDIANELDDKLHSYDRAYGKLIEGMLAMDAGNSQIAIERVKQSIDLTDLWLGRFHLGIIYLEAGYPAEALSQFEICESRIGEASSLFLDDVPTWRYTATLKYWKARTHDAIDMRTPAINGYQTFLTLRPEPTDDPLAVDARRRVMALTAE